MGRKAFGLGEAILFGVFVLAMLVAPLFSLEDGGASSLVPFYAYAAARPSSMEAISTYVFLPLFLLWGLVKAIVSFRLGSAEERKTSFWLTFIWAGLGIGYLAFLGAGNSYVAFYVAIVFTAFCLVFYYLERRFLTPKTND